MQKDREELYKLVDKAEVLDECLPYLRKFRGKTIVIKYGGSAMVKKELKIGFARDVTLLKHIGINPIVIHGGGPQISTLLKKMKIESKFIEGMRITDHETLNIVQMVLVGQVNQEIVSMINTHGGNAVGLSGKDGKLILAKKFYVEKPGPATDRPEIIDIGMVGQVTSVNIAILELLLRGEFIPVIAPVGHNKNGETFNINADFVAAAVAGAMAAEKIVLLTDEVGVLDAKGALISTLKKSETKKMINKGILPA